MVFRRWPAPRTVSLLVEQDGRVLLVRRGGEARLFPGTWTLPGGEVRDGETVYVAAQRVARELLGIEATAVHLECEFRAPSPFQDSRGDDAVVRVVAFEGEIGGENGSPGWYLPGALDDLVIFREARDTLRALLGRAGATAAEVR